MIVAQHAGLACKLQALLVSTPVLDNQVRGCVQSVQTPPAKNCHGGLGVVYSFLECYVELVKQGSALCSTMCTY
jgi:hypothetical protein